MPTVEHPDQPCPDCGKEMKYTGSLPPGGAYRPGDAFKTSPTNHYYECEPCEGKHILTAEGNLIPLGPSGAMRRQP
jgi:hypothetical protein